MFIRDPRAREKVHRQYRRYPRQAAADIPVRLGESEPHRRLARHRSADNRRLATTPIPVQTAESLPALSRQKGRQRPLGQLAAGWASRHSPSSRDFLTASALPPSPVARPTQRRAASHHCAIEISAVSQTTPGRCSAAARTAVRTAGHGRGDDPDVARRHCSPRATEETDELVPGLQRRCARARLVSVACFIHFARSDAGQTYFRPFAAPDRSIAIVNRGRRAGECLTRRHNCGRARYKKKKHPPAPLANYTTEQTAEPRVLVS